MRLRGAFAGWLANDGNNVILRVVDRTALAGWSIGRNGFVR